MAANEPHAAITRLSELHEELLDLSAQFDDAVADLVLEGRLRLGMALDLIEADRG